MTGVKTVNNSPSVGDLFSPSVGDLFSPAVGDLLPPVWRHLIGPLPLFVSLLQVLPLSGVWMSQAGA